MRTDRPLQLSVVLLAGIVLFACVGLAFDANWTKLLRVSSAFTTYAVVLLATAPRAWSYPLAGALAGAASGLVRPEPTAALVIVSALGGAVFGYAHRLGVHRFRSNTRLTHA